MTTRRRSTIIAKYRSASRPNVTYTVRAGCDHHLYCDCPAWRFQHKPAWQRDCRHTLRARERLIDRFVVSRARRQS